MIAAIASGDENKARISSSILSHMEYVVTPMVRDLNFVILKPLVADSSFSNPEVTGWNYSPATCIHHPGCVE
jgi:hypothetical protein